MALLGLGTVGVKDSLPYALFHECLLLYLTWLGFSTKPVSNYDKQTSGSHALSDFVSEITAKSNPTNNPTQQQCIAKGTTTFFSSGDFQLLFFRSWNFVQIFFRLTLFCQTFLPDAKFRIALFGLYCFRLCICVSYFSSMHIFICILLFHIFSRLCIFRSSLFRLHLCPCYMISLT